MISTLCDSSAILRLFYVLKLLFTALQIIIPLLCIFMLTKNFFMAILNKDPQGAIKENLSKAGRMMFAAFAFFFVPVVVKFAVSGLANQNIDLAMCFVDANLENIKYYEKLEKEMTKEEREKTIEELREAAKESEAVEKAKIEKQKQNASTQTTDPNRPSNYNENAVLASGTSNRYFAPLQGSSRKFGSINATGGCSNQAQHDIGASVGTPIYAGMDGTVTYYQYTCNGVLYSYGNLATLRGENGTYIQYAHLSAFPEGIVPTYTANCPKKSGGGAPCPSTACSRLTKTELGSKTVHKGQILGYTGDTGNSTGPHLHVEIHENGGKACVANLNEAFGLG